MVIVSRIIHGKVGWRLNASNKSKDQRRLLNRLATFMLRGTPCTQPILRIRMGPEVKTNLGGGSFEMMTCTLYTVHLK